MSAIVSTCQVSWPHTLWKLLVGAQPPDIGLIWVKRSGQAVQDAQSAKNAEQILQTDTPLAPLQAGKRVARNPRSVGQLGLCQAAQLSPAGEIVRDLSEGATNWRRHAPRRTAPALTNISIHHMTNIIRVSVS